MKKVYVQFAGGLGNQMFQYSFLKELRYLGVEADADITWYDRTKQDIQYQLDQVFPNTGHVDVNDRDLRSQQIPYYVKMGLQQIFRLPRLSFQEKDDSRYDGEMFQKRKGILQGYWQSEKYFTHVREELLHHDFVFQVQDSELKKVEEKLNQEGTSVSLHVRRGDYLNTSSLYGGICTEQYYRRAIQYIEERVEHPIFYLFTNDIKWAKENFVGDKFRFPGQSFGEGYQDWYDMYLMSRCQHNIIANSSFSWWGAWLNQNSSKIVISPAVWLNGKETPDIWCNDWVRIEG